MREKDPKEDLATLAFKAEADLKYKWQELIIQDSKVRNKDA